MVGALILVVFLGFMREWFTPDLLAISGMFLLLALGILPLEKGLGAFSNSAPLIVACMFVLSAALDKTGVIEALGRGFEAWSQGKPLRILALIIVIVGPLSGFVNNTPVVVVFLPILLKLCRKHDLIASRFLIPLSYAAIAGGTCTLIGTSTNIIAAEIAAESGLTPFRMFDITLLGLIYLTVVAAYLLTVGRRLLPDRITLSTLFDADEHREYLTQAYIRKNHTLDGVSYADSPLAKLRTIRLIEVIRNGRVVATPLNHLVFEAGDQLVMKGRMEGVMKVSETEGMEVESETEMGLGSVRTESAVLMEGMVGPDSRLTGKTLKELHFRQRYGVLILAVHRQGENLRDRFENTKLEFGDTVLVQGPADKMRKLFDERDFINLSAAEGFADRQEKAPWAIVALAAFILLGAFSTVPTVVIAFGVMLLTLFAGCLTAKEAYDAIDWRILFLIFGMIAIGMAVDVTGLANTIGSWLVAAVGGAPNPFVVVAVVYLTTSIMTEIISNNAVAAVFTPIVLEIGKALEWENPLGLVVAVMFGASASFSTPIGYQTNTFVYGAGGYRFSDFFRVGIPLNLLLWMTATIAIPLLWPLG